MRIDELGGNERFRLERLPLLCFGNGRFIVCVRIEAGVIDLRRDDIESPLGEGGVDKRHDGEEMSLER